MRGRSASKSEQARKEETLCLCYVVTSKRTRWLDNASNTLRPPRELGGDRAENTVLSVLLKQTSTGPNYG